MKKLITLCFFALAVIFGIQSAEAQQKEKLMEEQVKIESMELQKLLDLDENQTAMVWRALMVKEKAAMEMAHKGITSNEDVQKYTDKIEMNFKEKLISVLTEEQFAKYSEYLAEKKTKQ